MKKYRCIKEFTVPEIDDDGYETGNDLIIKKYSIWELGNDNPIDAEITLDGSGGWIGLSKENLADYFEEMKEGE